MSVLRRDPATGRWVVYVNNIRKSDVADGPCPFCEGNEHLTPPEIAAWGRERVEPDRPGWRVRVVANDLPLLRIEEPLRRYAEGMHDAASGMGAHEIVIETPEHHASLSKLTMNQVAEVLEAYAERIRDLKQDRRIRSVFVFKNHGTMAGAGLPGHAHAQVIGLPVTPKTLKEMLTAAQRYYREKERCVYCDSLEEEMRLGTRMIDQSSHFVAFAPYASRHPFEVWIAPRRHSPDFESQGREELLSLSQVLLSVLDRIERVVPGPAYNLFLYSGPNRTAFPDRWKTLAADFHWHIEILPRLVREAGFEIGSGFYANFTTPEHAAEALRSVVIPG